MLCSELRRLLLLALMLALLLGPAASAQPQPQPQPGPGYALRVIDGEQAVGEHFALTERPFGGWTGFFYLADEQRLVAASCSGELCNGANSVSNASTDRGRHVSAALRPALSNRPIAAYYDADAGDLVVADCQSTECTFAIERVLDSVGDVGQGTATAVDPATGLAVIAYYDASNGDLKLYRCSTATCDAGSAVVVDATNDRGRNPGLVFAGSTLWIAYEEQSSGQLLLASAATPFNVFTVLSLGVGAEPALSVDGGGLLDIVWRNRADDSLTRLRCHTADCSSSTISGLAAAGRGHRPAVARTPGGNLLVSHFEPATTTLHGSLCLDEGCAAPQALSFDSSPVLGGKSVVGMLSGGLPIAFHQDAQAANVLSSRCTSAACDAYSRRIAYNGLPVGEVRLAMRPDGLPVLAYIRQRQPWLALCADALCEQFSRFALPGFNSDTRPALGVRPDDRPFAYFASVGGSQAYDCVDADCMGGELREVSGSGNSTSSVIELALREDGRPVLLYAVSNLNQVYVFVCDDLDCSSGTQRLLVAEPSPGSTFLSSFAIIVGPGDRPIVMYSLGSPDGNEQRFVRCDDNECSSATARTIGSNINFFGQPLAVRNDGKPVFIESNFSSHSLGICDNADCTGVERVPLPGSGQVRSMRLQDGDTPVFASTSGAVALLTTCVDPVCSDANIRLVLNDPRPSSSYLGVLATGTGPDPSVALEEQARGDVLLAVPYPDALFGNGFEAGAAKASAHSWR